MDDDPIESDENDDDYVPSEEEEEESDDAIGSDYELEEASWKLRTKGKRKRKQTRSRRTSPRKRRGGVKLEEKEEKDESEDDNNGDVEEEEVSKHAEDIPIEKPVEEEKKKADSLWADFLKDVDPPPKSRLISSSKPQTQTKDPLTETANTKKTTITQVFDFAGESVSVTKEIDANSEEAKLQTDSKDEEKSLEEASIANSGGVKRAGNLGNVLGQIMGKKSKLTTLEKSRLDWETFKKEENIEDELRLHNKGKDGYLERQAFLQRVDVRQFEIEKDIRAINRSKR